MWYPCTWASTHTCVVCMHTCGIHTHTQALIYRHKVKTNKSSPKGEGGDQTLTVSYEECSHTEREEQERINYGNRRVGCHHMQAKKMTLGRSKLYNNLGYMGTTTLDKPILRKLDAVKFLIF